jgi:F-type H+-transporting ATPase subunit alpha
MKKVAPKLRLDLAAFRELQDFARLGTDLDEAAQQQLDRGYRMVEILKQRQFAPMKVPEEVLSILAGSIGVLDDIDVHRVIEAPEYLQMIEEAGDLSDDLLSGLTDAVEAYKQIYRFSFGA